MIYRPEEVQAAFEVLPRQGYVRIRDAFDPSAVMGEAHFPKETGAQGWEGVLPVGGPIEDLPAASPNTRELCRELGEITSAAGHKDWEVNRFMFNLTTEGYPRHSDRESFQEFVVLAYFAGRTEMMLQAGEQKPRGLVMNPGDIALVGAGTVHEVRKTGRRAFLGLVNDRPEAQVPWMSAGGR